MINQISLGPLTIYFYGIIAAFSIILALILSLSRAGRFKLKQDTIYDLFLFIFPFSLIGARIYHVVDKHQYYCQFPIKILFLWEGGLAIYGALLGGILAVWIFSKIKKIKFLNLLDLLAPSVALTQSIGRWGNYFNQEAYGPPINPPLGTFILPENRLPGFEAYQYFHPTFFYESILMFLTFIILLKLTPKLKESPGKIVSIYFILYGIIRFFLEYLRLDTQVLFVLKPAQFFSLAFIIFGLILLKRKSFHKYIP